MKLFWIMAFFFSISAGAAPIEEIRIDAEGLAPDQVQNLKTMTEFLPGDEFEDKKNKHSLEKIKDHLVGKGYVDVQVSDSIEKNLNSKTVLKYQINLGIPLKISSVNVISLDEPISQQLLQKIQNKIDLKPNELLDRDRLKDMRRLIEITMLGQDFIDTRVIDLKTEFVGDRSYKVVFKVSLGQRIVFSVSGNEFFSRSELATVIDEQRQIGLGRDYVTVLMNRLKDHYLDYGFRSISITPYTFEAEGNEPKKVMFKIEEGPKVRIRNVIFDGQESISSETLEDLFFELASDRLQSRIYNEKMIDSAGKALIEELKRRGYLSAKLIAVKTEELKEKEVNLRIFINEGVQTITQSVDFSGNQVISSSQLKQLLQVKEDQPLSLSGLEAGLEAIKKAYRNLGYLDVKITNENSGELVVYSERNQFAIINIIIEEGLQTFYGGAQVFGLEYTKQSVIDREILFQVDDPVSEEKLLDIEDRLRRLGIFSQVTIELVQSGKGPQHKNLKISVSESVPGNLAVGLGFRNDLGLRLFGEISYSNLWGLNHSWAFSVSGNRRVVNYRFTEFKVQTGYVWPWFTFGETALRPNLTAERRQYRAFDAETYGFSATLDRMLLNSKKLQGSLTYTIEQIRQFNAVDQSQNQQIRIGTITPALRLDLRDHPLTPRSGFFSTASFEYANNILGSQEVPFPVSYGRFQSRTDFYLNFIPRVVWYSSVRGGWLKNFANTLGTGSDFSIPLIKQFALGGVNSMRGYIEQEINVQANDREKRVRNFMTFVNYRTQLDFSATSNLSIGPFLDAGNLNVDYFTLGALKYGTGLGLRYMTPVGPVNFDWGFKLFSRNFAESNVFYFSLGVN
jgi:outer membrane protein insertion porin family